MVADDGKGVQRSYLASEELYGVLRDMHERKQLMFERADAFVARLNYGIALLEKRSFTEAEEQLRQALKRNEASPVAHYYLGLTLLSRRSYDEAEKELLRTIELSGDSLSLAHKYLGGLYWRKGDYARAVTELELYLKLSPNAPDAEQIRGTINNLRSKTGSSK